MHNYAILADCRKKWIKKRKIHGKMHKQMDVLRGCFYARRREDGYFCSEISDKTRSLCVVYSKYAILM